MIVTVDEMKTHLRIDDDEEDDYLASLITQCQCMAEDYCRVTFEGVGSDGSVAVAPEPVRLAVMLMVSHLYEYRDGNDHVAYQTTIEAFQRLLYPYRDPDKMF